MTIYFLCFTVGFVKVSDILELHAYAGGWQKFREKDIRRVVAGHPILTLDEGPPLKIRTNGGHAGSDELNEVHSIALSINHHDCN